MRTEFTEEDMKEIQKEMKEIQKEWKKEIKEMNKIVDKLQKRYGLKIAPPIEFKSKISDLK